MVSTGSLSAFARRCAAFALVVGALWIAFYALDRALPSLRPGHEQIYALAQETIAHGVVFPADRREARVAVFDNEPSNLRAMARALRNPSTVFVRPNSMAVHSDLRPPPARTSIIAGLAAWLDEQLANRAAECSPADPDDRRQGERRQNVRRQTL